MAPGPSAHLVLSLPRVLFTVLMLSVHDPALTGASAWALWGGNDGGQEGKLQDRLWEQARTKVRRALSDKFQSNTEAMASLDPVNPEMTGGMATQTLRSSLGGLVPGIEASELDAIGDRLDPGRDGMVLKSDILHVLLPPPTDRSALSRLAAERHARGIYTRLQSREDALGVRAQVLEPAAGLASGLASGGGYGVHSPHADDRYYYAEGGQAHGFAGGQAVQAWPMASLRPTTPPGRSSARAEGQGLGRRGAC